jgi:hypothetical protein
MNPPLEDLASLYVLDQLAAPERADFEARLLRDPALAALVRDLEAGLARGVRSLPPAEPSAALLGQIEDRIDALVAARPGPVPSRRADPPRWLAFAGWGVAAVIAVSLATLAVQSLRHSPDRPMIVLVGLDAGQNTFTELPLRGAAKDVDSRFMQLASLAENYWKKPGDLPVKPPSATGDSRGYALFDPGSMHGFIAIEQLPAIAAGQSYHLWIVDPATGRVHDAGILPLTGTTRGLYSFTLGPSDSPESTRLNFFVTVEDVDAITRPAKPRGKVVLGSNPI